MDLLERFETLPDALKNKIMGYYPGPAPKFLKQLKRRCGNRYKMDMCSNCCKFFQKDNITECNGMDNNICDLLGIKFCWECSARDALLYETYEGPMCRSCCDDWYVQNQYI